VVGGDGGAVVGGAVVGGAVVGASVVGGVVVVVVVAAVVIVALTVVSSEPLRVATRAPTAAETPTTTMIAGIKSHRRRATCLVLSGSSWSERY